MTGNNKTMLTQTSSGGLTAVYPELQDRRVIITGGATGIGAGLVEGFVAQGAQVVFVDIQDAEGEALAARLTAGARHAPVYRHLDLVDIDSVSQTIRAIVSDMGGIDVLVNNAANDDRHAIADVTPEYWDNRIAVNLRHLFFAAQAVVPSMKQAGGGVILNFGSISWHLALPDIVLYQTAKAGIEGMTRGMARDLGEHGIRVNTIVPGGIKTPRQDMLWHDDGETARILANQCLKERVLPADVAALTLFLASDDARMCTGHDYFVDAGWR